MRSQGHKPFSGECHVQNIEHGPVYRAGIALYITLGRMDSISLEVLIALAGFVLAGLVYFATAQRNRMQANEMLGASERLAVRTRIIDQYASNLERRKDAGPHLLATLGLPQLRTDQEIREVIEEIRRRTGYDPWEGAGKFVEGLDLQTFFEAAAEQRIDFLRTPVEEFVTQLDVRKRHAA